jgi:hypothetical protein
VVVLVVGAVVVVVWVAMLGLLIDRDLGVGCSGEWWRRSQYWTDVSQLKCKAKGKYNVRLERGIRLPETALM